LFRAYLDEYRQASSARDRDLTTHLLLALRRDPVCYSDARVASRET